MKREKLSALEHAQLREQLLSRIRDYQPTYREFAWMRFSFLHVSRSFVYVALVVLVFVTGGGASYAAEGSLPGSLLYPLKVRVTEPLREKLAFSAVSQAHLEAELAERRLSEASGLASEGRLDQKVKDSLFAEAARRAIKFKEKLAEADGNIDPESAADVSSHLEASLDAHVRLAEQDEIAEPKPDRSITQTATTAGAIPSSLDELRNSAREVSRIRMSAEEKISDHRTEALKKRSENKFKQVSKEYDQTRALLERRAGRIPQSAASDIRQELNAVRTSLDAGKADLESGSYQDTIPKLLEAGRAVQSAKIILDATGEEGHENN